jgi:hypothetical protein
VAGQPVRQLPGQRAVFLSLKPNGQLKKVRVPPALREFGRIRTIVDGPGSVIYVTTDNGAGNDAILAVRPKR